MSRNTSRILRTYTTVDQITGEVVDQRQTYQEVQSAAEPPYSKMYDRQGSESFGQVPMGFVLEVVRRTTYANKGQVFLMNASSRAEMAKQFDCCERMIERWIRQLVAGEVLRRVQRGQYRVNPYYFGKGSWPVVSDLRLFWDAEGKKGAAGKSQG